MGDFSATGVVATSTMDRSPPPTAANVVNLASRRPGDSHESAVSKAMDWLAERHRKGWRQAFADWMELIGPEDQDNWQLDDDGKQMLAVNAGEWLLARGEIFVKGEMRNINAHLLGRDGPWFSPAQQHWIAQLAQRPLRLWRVTEVRVDQGLTLVDALDNESAPVVVQERSGSRSAEPGMLMGARVMDCVGDQGEHLELSGAVYPFAKLREAGVMAEFAAALDAGLHPDNNRELAERVIARRWLAQWFEPLPMPELRDASTGQPMLLVTDHYRVQDAAALAQALAAQPEVSGNASDGWHREAVGSDGQTRSLVAINPGRSADRIELFARTQQLADEGRAWFAQVAGAAVQHLTREITDPRSTAALQDGGRRMQTPALPPEEMTALFEQVMRSQYARWADEPIPVLGDRTPRQAIATAGGLERVKGLLGEYESSEARMAASDGRGTISFQFLWDALGIAR